MVKLEEMNENRKKRDNFSLRTELQIFLVNSEHKMMIEDHTRTIEQD